MDPLTAITVGGAAGVAILVLKWMVDGKLHTDSEVQGLKADKADLLKINAAFAEALKLSNEQQGHILRILRDDPDLGGPPR